MKKINGKIKVGTKVKVIGVEGFKTVEKILNDKFIKIAGIEGMFQNGHILKFTNK